MNSYKISKLTGVLEEVLEYVTGRKGHGVKVKKDRITWQVSNRSSRKDWRESETAEKNFQMEERHRVPSNIIKMNLPLD